MNARTTITALVTGFPPGLTPPEPLPGETLLQLVVRNHPLEWRNCVDRLLSKHQVALEEAAALRDCRFDLIVDPVIRSEIERFMNQRLPTHGRTIGSLKQLQGLLGELPLAPMYSFELLEILWPRRSGPDDDRAPAGAAELLGAKVIEVPSAAPPQLNPVDFLAHVRGELLWLVPGGTRLMPALVTLGLERVVRHFRETPRFGMYMDSAASILFRTSALAAVAARGLPGSAESREMARSLQAAGYTFAADDNPDAALCDWEPEYGGPRRKLQAPGGAGRPWWRRLFGG